jgi:hypothetical protein
MVGWVAAGAGFGALFRLCCVAAVTGKAKENARVKAAMVRNQRIQVPD